MIAPITKNILIVEDDLAIVNPMIHALERIGYHIVAVLNSGEEAIEQVTMPPYPDVVIMDVVLGGRLTGIEASKKLDPALKLPIIFITGYRPVAAAMEANNRFPLAKPFSALDLKKAIETALAA